MSWLVIIAAVLLRQKWRKGRLTGDDLWTLAIILAVILLI